MEEQLTTKQVGMKYGLYMAVISIIYGLLLQILGVAGNQALGYVGFIFFIVLLVLAHNEFKKANGGFMSYGEGFGISAYITVISVVLSTIFTYIYLKFVDDSMLTMIREKTEDTLLEKGMSDAQIEQALEVSGKFQTPEMILVFGIVGGIIMYLIVALIVGAITKKPNPDLEA